MKNCYLLLLFITTIGFSQAVDHAVFDYDDAGNQIKRRLVDLTARPSQQSPVKKEITAADLITSDIYDDIKYYPNPVIQELYVSWTVKEGSHVRDIVIYNLQGQLISKIEGLLNKKECKIQFSGVADGIYSVNLVFENGQQKSLKIIKNGS